MIPENNSRTHLIITVAILEQLNKMDLPQDKYWEKFALDYNVRTGTNNGADLARLIQVAIYD